MPWHIHSHTCQPETTKKTELFWTEMFHHSHYGAPSPELSGKPHNFILKHLDSQHDSVYLNKEVILRFPKHLVALLEAPYIAQSALTLERTDATVAQYGSRIE